MKDLKIILDKYSKGKEKEYFEANIETKVSFSKLKEAILLVDGRIIEEDSDNQIYVCSVFAGSANCNEAVVVLQMEENKCKVIAHAKEGLISQHTAKKAIKRIEEKLLIWIMKS